jgi:hypothetical protein
VFSSSGHASTVWNVGFDAGTGLGAVVIGAVLSSSGAPGAFALAGLFAFAALPVALAVTRSAVSSVRRESRREPDPSVP